MWPEFIHHLTLHFAIVLPMVMAAIGTYAVRANQKALIPLLRWGGWITLVLTAITVIAGVAAGGLSGGEEVLKHHRYLGILTAAVVVLAAISFEQGVRRKIEDLRTFSVAMWWTASFSVIGAGHWGTLGEHADVIPGLF